MISQTRFNAIRSGLTSIAQKVLNAVPMAESWDTRRISAELQRLGGGHEYRVIGGCLNSLIEAGLVIETAKGEFRRVAVREAVPPKITSPEEIMKPVIVKPVTPAVERNPVDKLGDLAERVAAMAASLKELAEEITDAALDIQAKSEADADGIKKLGQLQALLKALG